MDPNIKAAQQYCREMEDVVLRTAYHTAAAAGTPWHLDPDIDRAFVERVLPVPILHLGSTKPGDLADAERPAWRMTPVTIEFPVAEGESPVPQFTNIIASLARQAVSTRDVGREFNPDFKDGGVLMVMWRKRPRLETHQNGILHAYARLIFSFMPRSFLGTEPNNGVQKRVASDPDHIAPTPKVPINPTANWWRKYYDSFKDSFADHGIAIDEAAEVPVGAWQKVAKARTEAMIRQGKVVIEKRAASEETPTDWDALVKKVMEEARQHKVLAAREFLDKKGVVLNDLDVFGGGIYGEKPPVDMNAYFDNKKKFAREERIKRNEMADARLCEPIGKEAWFRALREDRLATAIEKTELPHEATIHDRLMPYRHREG